MWIFAVALAVALGFLYLGAFTIFFADDITEWFEAKADYYRAKAALLRQDEEIARKEGTE